MRVSNAKPGNKTGNKLKLYAGEMMLSNGFKASFNRPQPTIHKTPTVLGWGFFLSVRDGSHVFARVLAEACGLRRSAIWSVFGHLSLSLGYFSLRPRSPRMPQSPQRPNPAPFQINGLRADDSSGCFMALPGDGNRPDSKFGEGRDRPQTEGQLPAICRHWQVTGNWKPKMLQSPV